jgi:all-trans-retinol 13,14-reductase
MKHEAIVIGGGVSGMTAALLLARQGRRVHLVERSSCIASLLKGACIQGVHFDIGLHYSGFWGNGEPLDNFTTYLGMQDDVARIPFDPDGYDRLLCMDSGLSFDMPYGRARIEEAFAASFPSERRSVRSFLRHVGDACAISPMLNPKLPLSKELSFEVVSRQGLREVLASLDLSPRLRTLLSIHCLHFGCEPDQASFADFSRVAGSFHASVHTADGGGKAVAEAFAKALEREGVELSLKAGVTSIGIGADASVKHVELSDGRFMEADAVIYTGHPASLPEMLPAKVLRPSYSRRLVRLVNTPSAYMLFGATEERMDLLDRRNVVVLPKSNGERILRRYGPREDRPLFISMDQNSGRPGRRGVIVLAAGDYAEVEPWASTRAAARPQAYEEHKAVVAQAIEAQVMAACPELQGKVKFLASATPLTIAEQLKAPRGGLYGALHSMGQNTPLPVTKVPGLYLAGQGIVCPGLLGSMISAFLACGFIVGHETLRKGLAACTRVS